MYWYRPFDEHISRANGIVITAKILPLPFNSEPLVGSEETDSSVAATAAATAAAATATAATATAAASEKQVKIQVPCLFIIGTAYVEYPDIRISDLNMDQRSICPFNLDFDAEV
jgi:hypothetical protein